MKRIMLSLIFCGVLVSCVDSKVDDESMYLTGTEESAVTGANGQPACTNPKKELVCHIPPGNPDNAHEICVGKPAVEPHQEHHGDYLGPCVPPPPPDDDPPPPPPGGDDVSP
jgi:hypothetical protein